MSDTGADATRVLLIALLDQIEKLLGDVRDTIADNSSQSGDEGGTEQHG